MVEVGICYVDCTGTFVSGQNSGIQRVVRNIVSRLQELEHHRGYRFVPVISTGSELNPLCDGFDRGYPLTHLANRTMGGVWNLLEQLLVSKRMEPVIMMSKQMQSSVVCIPAKVHIL
ncbi:MAG: hypothetical protein WCK54_15770 [Desulfuromonadales bacterium]